VRLLVLLNGNQ